jgi:hypothetical protein
MAMIFTASNYVRVTNPWPNLANVTYCFWVYFNTLNATSNRLLGTDTAYEIRTTTDFGGGMRFANELFSSDAVNPSPAVSTTVAVIDTWYHVAATINADKSVAQIIINSVLEASGGPSTDIPTFTNFGIGNRGGAPGGNYVDGQCCNGIMDDIRYYNRVLTLNEIATIYNSSGRDSIVDGLQARWMLNEQGEGIISSGTDSIKDLADNWTGTPVLQLGSNPVYTGSRLTERRLYR